MVTQSTYTERMRAGLPGMIATERTRDISSRVVENSNGIAFGLACGQGAADNGVKLGGTLAEFVGVSVRDVTLLPVSMDSDYADEYQRYANCGVMTMGDIWVVTDDAVTKGDAVHFNATTGVLGNSGGSGPIPGARWETTTAVAGLAILHLSGIHKT